jgi:hypothetical protein
LIGDFNAKTCDTQDYISKDEKLSQYLDVYDDSDFLDYMDDLYTLHKVNVPVGRYTSCNANLSTFGHMLIQLGRAHNLYIGNGRLGKEKFIGKKTCKNSTVIDYFILFSNVFQLVNEFEVMNVDHMQSDTYFILCKRNGESEFFKLCFYFLKCEQEFYQMEV